MTLFLAAYLAGALTIATPCVFPVLPFVLARADQPFRRGALPMLLGLAGGFAATASLAAVAGGWAVTASRVVRTAALILLAMFGLTMLLPGLAARVTAPIVSVGARLLIWTTRRPKAGGTTITSALLLGVATGLIWAPCAGPVLGLILTGAALRGPSIETSLLLLTYGAGAATSLAAGAGLSGRLLAAAKRSIGGGDVLRRLVGAAVIAGTAGLELGLDAIPAGQWSSAMARRLEDAFVVIPVEDPKMVIPSAPAGPSLPLPAPLAALLGAKAWLNTPGLQPTDLSRHVVLVNFWTYSCINCLRVLPHVRAWAQTYGTRGLLVVGVHTPEFAFEKDSGNVSQALARLGVTYPIAIDSDFAIWRAFTNQAWPALYFIGFDGRIRHRVFGEGSYEQSERLIQQLLSEAATAPVSVPVAPATGKDAQAEADAANLRSGETYIGYSQATGFASADAIQRDVRAIYRIASPLAINRWGLAGAWTVGGEFATLEVPGGRIAYRFHARDLHLVLAPFASARAIRFRVTLDGLPPGPDHGADVDAEGWGNAEDARLYQMIRQSGPITDRTFEIEFFDAGLRAYVFTFG